MAAVRGGCKRASLVGTKTTMNARHLERRARPPLHRQTIDANNVGATRLTIPAIRAGVRVSRFQAHQYIQREELRVLCSVVSHGLDGRGDGRDRKSRLGNIERNSQTLPT